MVDNIRLVLGALEDFTEQIIREITIEATANLIEGTPVDTGWARANWVPSIGEGSSEDLTDVDPDAAIVNAARAEQQRGIADVSLRYRLMLGAVFITNNVPYIVNLNDGSSTQAPKAFVQSAIRRAAQQVRPISP